MKVLWKERCYVLIIFTTNHRWLVVIGSNLNLTLRLHFFPTIITSYNLPLKIYCKNVVDISFPLWKYGGNISQFWFLILYINIYIYIYIFFFIHMCFFSLVFSPPHAYTYPYIYLHFFFFFLFVFLVLDLQNISPVLPLSLSVTHTQISLPLSHTNKFSLSYTHRSPTENKD